jgi:hypothetical protein
MGLLGRSDLVQFGLGLVEIAQPKPPVSRIQMASVF